METSTLNTHPRQRMVTYGTHFMRVVDISRLVIDFGHVPTFQEQVDTYRDNRLVGTVDIHLWDAMLDDHRFRICLDNLGGNIHALVANRLTFNTRAEVLHQSQVWPISRDLYFAAKRADWDLRNMNGEDYNAFRDAFREWETREQPRVRRTFDAFVTEVENNVLASVGKGHPRTYLGYNRIGDRHLVLRFGDWSHAVVARTGLEGAMFHVRTAHTENALSVMDRSEA